MKVTLSVDYATNEIDLDDQLYPALEMCQVEIPDDLYSLYQNARALYDEFHIRFCTLLDSQGKSLKYFAEKRYLHLEYNKNGDAVVQIQE